MVEPVSGPAPSGIGLKLYDKSQNVLWHNPRVTDQFKPGEGALLIGAGENKKKFTPVP